MFVAYFVCEIVCGMNFYRRHFQNLSVFPIFPSQLTTLFVYV